MGFGLRRSLAAPTENVILDGEVIGRLRADVGDIFEVTEVAVPRQAQHGVVIFTGRLLMADSEAAYDRLAERWARHDYTPLLRAYKGQQQLIGQPGLVKPRPSNPWINLALFVATVLSVVYVGAINEGVDPLANPANILRGVPFAFTLLVILGTHEFGHYFAARYHKVAVTLPYFIPVPFPQFSLGTLGAFIQLRAPVRNRNQLLDVGVAGPLAGLLVTLPLLFYGLSISKVGPPPAAGGYIQEGNSLLYAAAKYLVYGQFLPSNGVDVNIGPVAFAAWFGLFVTALNLLPIGQLDGGHVIFTLAGDKARIVGTVFALALLALGILWPGWFLWAAIVFLLLGVDHPAPLNDITPLNNKHRLLALLAVVVFILVFTPIPFSIP